MSKLKCAPSFPETKYQNHQLHTNLLTSSGQTCILNKIAICQNFKMFGLKRCSVSIYTKVLPVCSWTCCHQQYHGNSSKKNKQPAIAEHFIWTDSVLGALQNCCCCSVAKSCLTLCDPVDCSTSGSSVLQYLPEFAQIHAIQPSHLLSPSYPSALNLSQLQGPFQRVSYLHQVSMTGNPMVVYQSLPV